MSLDNNINSISPMLNNPSKHHRDEKRESPRRNRMAFQQVMELQVEISHLEDQLKAVQEECQVAQQKIEGDQKNVNQMEELIYAEINKDWKKEKTDHENILKRNGSLEKALEDEYAVLEEMLSARKMSCDHFKSEIQRIESEKVFLYLQEKNLRERIDGDLSE